MASGNRCLYFRQKVLIYDIKYTSVFQVHLRIYQRHHPDTQDSLHDIEYFYSMKNPFWQELKGLFNKKLIQWGRSFPAFFLSLLAINYFFRALTPSFSNRACSFRSREMYSSVT